MLWTLFVILLVLWGLGLLTGYTMGGVIHALLVNLYKHYGVAGHEQRRPMGMGYS